MTGSMGRRVYVPINEWLILMVNIGKYTIPGSYGLSMRLVGWMIQRVSIMTQQVVQAVAFVSPKLEVTNNHWKKRHVFTIPKKARLESTGTWMVDFYNYAIHVGKYTVRPMDPSWELLVHTLINVKTRLSPMISSFKFQAVKKKTWSEEK